MKKISAGTILTVLMWSFLMSGCIRNMPPAAEKPVKNTSAEADTSASASAAKTVIPAEAGTSDPAVSDKGAADRSTDPAASGNSETDQSEERPEKGKEGTDQDRSPEKEQDSSESDSGSEEYDSEDISQEIRYEEEEYGEYTNSEEYSSEEEEEEDKEDDPEEEEGGSPHIHDWVEVIRTVHHEGTGHFEEYQAGTRTVVDEEDWDEPVYEARSICTACGYEADSTSEIIDHLDCHYDPELGYIDAGYYVENVQVDTIHHSEVTHEEPVYEERWVTDSEAWDEEVVTGYRCSICGAQK